MKLNCKDIGLSLEIKDELLKKMKKHGKEHYPNEYGGLLVGRYSDDLKSVLIEESVLPMEFQSSRFKFERVVNGLKKVLHYFFKHGLVSCIYALQKLTIYAKYLYACGCCSCPTKLNIY